MSFDPATTAALIATLVAASDDGLFAVESAPTTIRSMPKRYPAAAALAPAPSEPAYLVAYTFMYRRIHYSGGIVCGQASIPIATGILAQDAAFQRQLYDLRNPVTEYTAGGDGVRAGP